MDDLDTRAANLCRDYQGQGLAAFIVRTTPSGDVRFIGPQLPPKLVAQMLRTAASGYEEQIAPETLN